MARTLNLSFRNFLLRAASFILLSSTVLGAESAQIEADQLGQGHSAVQIWKPYRQVPLPPVNTGNGPLLRGAIHDGKLELSLSDFLKLVVENGLDVESDRYIYLLAQTDLLRAR